MIEVNIWLNTARLLGVKLHKHGILGGFFASEGEHVGHANFQLEISEHSKYYSIVENNPLDLKMYTGLNMASGVASGSYNQKTIHNVVFPHSFWPDAPPPNSDFVKDCLHVFHLSKPGKGVKSSMSTHQIDMERENIPNSITTMQHGVKLKKSQSDLDKLQIEMLQEEIKTLQIDAGNLEVSLENQTKWTAKIAQLHAEQSLLIAKKQDLTTQHENNFKELQKEITKTSNELQHSKAKTTFLRKKFSYIKKTEGPRNKIHTEIETVHNELELNVEKQQQLQIKLESLTLQNDKEREITDCQRQIETNIKGIAFYQNSLDQISKVIAGRTHQDLDDLRTKISEKGHLLARKEYAFTNNKITNGRHADYVIQLPTSESGFEFYLHEVAILKAMQQEKSQKYSLVFNNCAGSAKRCMLAGMDEHLRTHLKEQLGFTDKFFQVKKLETSKSLRDWVLKLETGLTKLNFPATPQPR